MIKIIRQCFRKVSAMLENLFYQTSQCKFLKNELSGLKVIRLPKASIVDPNTQANQAVGQARQILPEI